MNRVNKIISIFTLSSLSGQVDISFSAIIDLNPVSIKVASYTSDETPFNLNTAVEKYINTRGEIAKKKIFTPSKSLTTRQIPGGKRLFQKCSPGVVLLVASNSIGSGSIINKKGDILTNWHVVDGHEKLYVCFFNSSISNIEDIDPNSLAVASVVAVDPKRDLALLRLDNQQKKLYVLERGKPYEIEISMDVFAIGHPESLIWSFTDGIISRVRKDHKWVYNEGYNMQADVIQTQTPINPGNSGGPLFNSKGQLIGINSFGHPTSYGLNFAIHLYEINEFIKDVGRGLYTYTPEKQKPEAEVSFEEYDINENGIIDSRGYHSPETGKIVVLFIDENEDGNFDIGLVDQDEDGKHDCEIYDRDGNGVFEYFIFDDDFNGTWDTVGVDTNGDEEPDTFFAYTG